MIVKPFRGLRPRHDLAARIPSPPYDVPTDAEARRLAAENEHSFLHVVRPEVDLPPDVDPHDPRVYAGAAARFRGMVERGWLVRDGRASFYVYRLTWNGRSQTGIVGAAAVTDYEQGRIERHEHTRPDKVADRVRLNESIEAHPGPVFLAYRRSAALDAATSEATSRPPVVRFRAESVDHELWVVDEPDRVRAIERGWADVPATYVADGHHRAEAAARLAATLRARLTAQTGNEPCHYFLTVHFPADELRILDYNRVVRDLAGLDPGEFVERIRDRGFTVRPGHAERRPPHRHSFGMYVAGGWYLLEAGSGMTGDRDPVESLDAAILARELLAPVLGIRDLRTDRRIDFVGGARGVEALERMVDSGEFAAAFALHPPTIDDVMRVADAGGIMPPKSTWFEPKLRSGLVVQSLEGDEL
jgi:uncharacterized protein (DUF1015 family)